jgi:hypothetical protein
MKTKTLTNVEVKDDDTGTVRAVFATLGVKDHDGDVILPGAIEDGAPVRISAYGHGSWAGRLPVGKGVIREVGNEAVFEGAFFTDTTDGLDTYRTMKNLGELGEWSFSLDVTETEPGELDGEPVTFIKSIRGQTEVSPVLRGAGVNTRTLDIKGRDLKFADEAQAVMAAVDSFIGRAAEVVTMRREKGKSLGATSRELLEWLAADLKRLDDLLADEESVEVPVEPDLREEANREYLRFIANNHAA